MRFIATIVAERQASPHETNIDLSHAQIEAPTVEAATGIAYLAASRLLKGKITCKVTPLESLGVITKADDARMT